MGRSGLDAAGWGPPFVDADGVGERVAVAVAVGVGFTVGVEGEVAPAVLSRAGSLSVPTLARRAAPFSAKVRAPDAGGRGGTDGLAGAVPPSREESCSTLCTSSGNPPEGARCTA